MEERQGAGQRAGWEVRECLMWHRQVVMGRVCRLRLGLEGVAVEQH